MPLRLPESWGLPESWVKSVKDKQYFDEDLSQGSLDLLEAAAALEVKEFTLFELAYRNWYGRRPLTHVIEAHFSNYMFHSTIPAWVGSYSRRIVELHALGRLDPRQFGVYQPLPSKRLIRIGKLFSTVLILVFVALVAILYKDPNVSQSLFGRADMTAEYRLPVHSAMP
jgi:hypothetical protein